MTFKEKLMQEHPDFVGDEHQGGALCCPSSYNYEEKNYECALMSCAECWNRTMPRTVEDEDYESCDDCVYVCKTQSECMKMNCMHAFTRPNQDGKIECYVRMDEQPKPVTEDAGLDKEAIKDSGDRTQFDTGAVRDMHEGKGRCDLLPMCVLLRLARHYENGCRKYGDRNWEKGIPCHSFADSAMRHMFKYMDGHTDEDHLIAAIWNLCGLAWTEEKHPELMDIPARQFAVEMEQEDDA